jgi:P-type Cu+ transporter
MDTAIDPVCGMTVEKNGTLMETYRGREYHFCSEECMHKFQDRPAQFAPAA